MDEAWQRRVRERAYALWEREGRPEGHAERHCSGRRPSSFAPRRRTPRPARLMPAPAKGERPGDPVWCNSRGGGHAATAAWHQGSSSSIRLILWSAIVRRTLVSRERQGRALSFVVR
jgi:Protein of unknown function (DUF2934)